MADVILHYEVTKGYGQIKEGQRFDAVKKGSNAVSISDIREGLATATGVEESKINLSMVKYEEI